MNRTLATLAALGVATSVVLAADVMGQEVMAPDSGQGQPVYGRIVGIEQRADLVALLTLDNGIQLSVPASSKRSGRLKPRLGQPGEIGGLKRELSTSVYLVDPSGRVDLVVSEDQVPDPNGLVFSPDYKKLYVISTGKGPGDSGPGGKGDMHVFDVGSDNTLSNRKLFTDFMIDGVKCGPDGARCDVDGNLWCSSNAGRAVGYSGVTVWTPEGKLMGRIRLPEVCGNVCFGGPKRNRLFMAASQSLYAIYVSTQGAAPG